MANKDGRRRFGSVRTLASGRIQARYLGPDGKVRTAPMTFKGKREAERWLTLKEAEIARGEWVDPDAGKITVQEWGSRWLESVYPSLKPKTRASYESLFRTQIIPRLGKVEIAKIRPITVSEWIASMNSRELSASRIRQAYVVLSQIMKSAVHNELIKASPCVGIKLPRLPQSQPRILTDEEVKRLLAAAEAPLDLMVQILVYAGLRIGEAFALRRACVDLETGHLEVAETLYEIAGRHSFGPPKSHEARVLRLPAFLVQALREHLDKMTDKDPSALLFVSKSGKPIHYNAWRTWRWDPAVKAAELEDVTPHDLRATHATVVAKRHGVMAAAARLGHSNASVTTRHYARTVEGTDDEIAAAFDADRDGTDEKLSGEPPEDLARQWHDPDDDDPPGVSAVV